MAAWVGGSKADGDCTTGVGAGAVAAELSATGGAGNVCCGPREQPLVAASCKAAARQTSCSTIRRDNDQNLNYVLANADVTGDKMPRVARAMAVTTAMPPVASFNWSAAVHKADL